ncbi:MAG: sodium:proton antiporter [Clostridia bacterium]|nr:sodium:proton antiporter [Clostridia bacterium]
MRIVLALLLLPLCGAVIAPLSGRKNGKVRELFVRLFTLAQLMLSLWLAYQAWQGADISLDAPGICGLGLHFRVDFFRAMYVLLASFMWACAAQFSPEYFAHHRANGGRYACFTLITLCGVMGVFLSDDLYTTFVFFEIMSIASYPWVAHEETEGAMRAAQTYLGVSVACGMVTLMGMFLCWRQTGSLFFADLKAHMGESGLALPAALMLVGYCAKAGMAPLHIWLPKAHPVAPAPASALLSGMLTKTGLFGVIAIGMNLMGETPAFGHVMLALGLVTMTLGAVLAVFSVNLKRTLACSSLSQIGYITVGLACAILLGHHGALPAAGTVGHMVNHSLLKLCLFLCAGAVYMNAHTLDLSKLRGFGRGKPLLHVVFLLGALGLAGVPLLNGYTSKTMIHESLVELAEEIEGFSIYRFCEWVFLFAAGLTTAYMLKLYICLFWQKNPDAGLQKKYDAMNGRYLTKRSAITLIVTAIPLPILGTLPNETLLRLTGKCVSFLNRGVITHLDFFSLTNLMGGGISLIIGTAVYMLFVRPVLYGEKAGYRNVWPAWLDLEELFYRPVFCRFLPALGCGIASFLDHLPDSRLVTKYFAGFFTLLARGCDELLSCRFVTKTIPTVLTAFGRVFDELVDHTLLLVRELFLTNRQELRRARNHSIFTRLASALAEGLHRAGRFLWPGRWLPQRDEQDMRYGNAVTNAVSFGLLLCAMGIVAAILYVFIRIGV